MRIVKNLKDITECPNCGDDHCLRKTEDQFGRPYVMCINCHEELFEKEDTCSTEKVTKEKKKENFIFEMREEISNLTWSISAHNARSLVLVENIQNILNRIIDYIEEN